MNPLDKNDECEFAKYFAILGYKYSWDFSRKLNDSWHELIDEDGQTILQVTMSVPLERVINDMCVEEDIDTEYFIASENEIKYRKLCEKVRAYELQKLLDKSIY